MNTSIQAAKIDIALFDHFLNQYIIPFGWKIIGAFAVWFLGSLIIRAIQKMKVTLADSVVFGVHTNISLLQEILSHEEFLNGTMTTRFFETHFGKGLSRSDYSDSEMRLIHQISAKVAALTAQ